MSKGTSFEREDIAAMEVVCDKQAAFSHKLNLVRMDLHWVLSLDKPPPPTTQKKNLPPSKRKATTSATPSRNRHQDAGEGSSTTADMTIGDVSTVQGESPSQSRVAEEGERGHEGEEDEPIPMQNGTGEQRRQNSARSHTPSVASTSQCSVRSKGKKFQFVPEPEIFKTLGTLDREQVVDATIKDEPLINSPRSAFVLLKNGYSIADICSVPVQEYYNKALLDGVTLETVKMRIAAEEERRQAKFDNILRTYDTLCDNVTREEVIDAIRQHKFAEDLTKEEDEKRLKDIPHYAHPGRLDLTVLDSDCIDVLQKSRSRTLMEIRRSLDQKDRLMKQSIERETSVMEKERQSRAETVKVQMESAQSRNEKAAAAKEKRVEVERRVEKLIKAQEEIRELRRENLLQEHHHQAERAKEKKQLERCAAVAMIDERQRRRTQVKDQQEQIKEERRAQLVERQELNARLKEREQQLRREDAERQARRKQEISEKKRETIKQLAETAAVARREKQESLDAEVEQRAKEYHRMKELRQRAKKQRAETRAQRTHEIREQGDLIKKHRTAELEREYEEKLLGIAQAQRDKKDRATLAREMAAQVHLEKVEEKERVSNVNEFDKIAYISEQYSKTKWMQRSDEKRKVLAAQVRQERQAMVRARQQVIEEMEANEVKRRKHAASEMLMAIEEYDISSHPTGKQQQQHQQQLNGTMNTTTATTTGGSPPPRTANSAMNPARSPRHHDSSSSMNTRTTTVAQKGNKSGGGSASAASRSEKGRKRSQTAPLH